MKQGTTPTLPIKIKVPFENVKRVEFIFKKNISKNSDILLYRVFEGNIPVEEPTAEDHFIVKLALSDKETMRLSVGDIYMDTRVTMLDGNIPETKIVKINISETLFEEAY
jgi:hypothetical protein